MIVAADDLLHLLGDHADVGFAVVGRVERFPARATTGP